VIVEDQCVVEIHYTLTSDSGDVIDSSAGKDPLKYLHGAGMLVPGLEREIAGKSMGDQFQVVVQPEDGYGVVDPELVQQVERGVLEGVEDLQVGMQLEAQSPEGDTHYVIVQEISDTHVTLNANAPLAGFTLHFDIQVEVVREASEQELEHGHAH
jgi:FKBP-type peptidyl-prolyl cis-trans isomerase SlyD